MGGGGLVVRACADRSCWEALGLVAFEERLAQDALLEKGCRQRQRDEPSVCIAACMHALYGVRRAVIHSVSSTVRGCTQKWPNRTAASNWHTAVTPQGWHHV